MRIFRKIWAWLWVCPCGHCPICNMNFATRLKEREVVAIEEISLTLRSAFDDVETLEKLSQRIRGSTAQLKGAVDDAKE